ncbi:hypothetical protein RchiOBHm_Chr6g0289071 [Rosa chinensis]|uniref:Uncharacterized protein n=1 Tax=Rosa chinensis TaxID=74649 RepID=A0A2P6PVG7_ROSCH|nr:hypothetical protein RchiOBHm_Chr6g0289071 [Rosa chinensis]
MPCKISSSIPITITCKINTTIIEFSSLNNRSLNLLTILDLEYRLVDLLEVLPHPESFCWFFFLRFCICSICNISGRTNTFSLSLFSLLSLLGLGMFWELSEPSKNQLVLEQLLLN